MWWKIHHSLVNIPPCAGGALSPTQSQPLEDVKKFSERLSIDRQRFGFCGAGHQTRAFHVSRSAAYSLVMKPSLSKSAAAAQLGSR